MNPPLLLILALGCMAAATPAVPAVRPVAPAASVVPAPVASALATPASVHPPQAMPLAAPSYQIAKRVRVRVTACSPEDPWDLAYYAANGYEGAIYGIAADPRVFPKGTILRVPGYREKHAPHAGGWTVDSKGGSVIRASSRRGIKHIDVKFRTLHSARAWGSRWLIVDVLTPTKAP